MGVGGLLGRIMRKWVQAAGRSVGQGWEGEVVRFIEGGQSVCMVQISEAEERREVGFVVVLGAGGRECMLDLKTS